MVPTQIRISAILTAAGESTRMGHPKALLEWHGVTLVEYQTTSLLKAGVTEVVVVLGNQHALITQYIGGQGILPIVNKQYANGKTTSIKAGLSTIDLNAEGILFLAVDQPRPSQIISSIINFHIRTGALITSPRHKGHGGHPLIFSSSLKTELESITEEQEGIRNVLRKHYREVTELEIDDPIVRLDLNSPKAYKEARTRYTI